MALERAGAGNIAYGRNHPAPGENQIACQCMIGCQWGQAGIIFNQAVAAVSLFIASSRMVRHLTIWSFLTSSDARGW